jgi:integrase
MLLFLSMASQEALFSGDAYRNFIYSIKSKATKTAYLKALKQFMQYRKVTTVEELLRGEPRLIQSFVIEWIIDLKERRNLSYSSVSLYSGALRHFYDMNDVTLNWKKIKNFLGEHVKTVKDRPYTRSEIRHLLDYCSDQRLKIIILLMCSAGLRVGAIPSIFLRNLTFIEKYGIYQIQVYENSPDEYVCFCSPECSQQIKQYLEYRKRNGEKPLKPNAPLIREEFDINDLIHATSPRPISCETLRHKVNRLLFASGARQRILKLETENPECQNQNNRHEVMECHAMRKYFDSAATTAGLNPLYVEMLMGHKIGLKGAYFRPTVTDLLEGNDKMLGYTSIINALTINDENRLRLQVEKLSSKDGNSQLIINTELKNKERQIEALTKKQEQIEQLVQSLIDSGQLKARTN